MDQYEMSFQWPHTEPHTVIVTGTFDQWSSSVYLEKGDSGFKGTARIPFGEKTFYKFVVDGHWLVNQLLATETDSSGNVNNVYTAPEKPTPTEASHTNGAVEKPNGTTPESASDLATTIAATDGTTSALDYVASGVGAAIHGVIGLDPINPDQMSVKSPVPLTPQVATPAPISEEPASPPANVEFASNVPIPILPVNAPENVPVADNTSEAAEAVSPPVGSTTSVVSETETVVQPSTHTPATPSVPEPSVDSLPVAEPSVDVAPAAEVVSSEISTPVASSVPAVSAAEASTHSIVPRVAEPVINAVQAATSEPEVKATPVDPQAEKTTLPEVSSEPAPAPAATEPSSASAVSGPAVETPKVNGSPPDISKVAEESAPAPATPSKVAADSSKVNGSTPAVSTASAPTPSTPAPAPSTPPGTPGKRELRLFPSSSESPGRPASPGSPTSSKFGTSSLRAKRKSIFGKMKLKSIFSKDKDKEKEK